MVSRELLPYFLTELGKEGNCGYTNYYGKFVKFTLSTGEITREQKINFHKEQIRQLEEGTTDPQVYGDVVSIVSIVPVEDIEVTELTEDFPDLLKSL